MRKSSVVLGSVLTLGLSGALFALGGFSYNFDLGFAGGIGSLVASTSDLFHVPPLQQPPGSNGTFAQNVYYSQNSGLYTYVQTVTPTENDAFNHSTAFTVDTGGYAGADTAGWSYSDAGPGAGKAGGTGTTMDFFEIANPGSSAFSWTTMINGGVGWDANETIRFFFRSTLGPNSMATFNLTAGPVGAAAGFAPAPAPEPSTLLLMGSAMLGLSLLRRRSSKN